MKQGTLDATSSTCMPLPNCSTDTLTYKLFGFNVIIHFTPVMSCTSYAVPAHPLQLLLYYHMITHRPPTLKTFSAIDAYSHEDFFAQSFVQICQL